jgi:hypothetical protein
VPPSLKAPKLTPPSRLRPSRAIVAVMQLLRDKAGMRADASHVCHANAALGTTLPHSFSLSDWG